MPVYEAEARRELRRIADQLENLAREMREARAAITDASARFEAALYEISRGVEMRTEARDEEGE